MTDIRTATQDDLDFLDQTDDLLIRAVLADKIDRSEIYVAVEDGRPVGLARYDFLCDLDPFLTLIYIREPHRRKGIGTQLMAHWEEEMRRAGHRVLLTSTQADEEAQFFYRKLGYSDSGAIFFPGQVAAELVLVKVLRPDIEATGPRQKP